MNQYPCCFSYEIEWGAEHGVYIKKKKSIIDIRKYAMDPRRFFLYKFLFFLFERFLMTDEFSEIIKVDAKVRVYKYV